jgi:ABC-type Zn uptake system ZnuABC Zn-binding protein ZnuA/ABC-type Mn2+/Zn2+ transport system permease subunit
VLAPFTHAFVQRGLVEVLLLAVASGIVGTWAVLRGLSFYAHAVGTAAFPGLVLAGGLGFSPALGAFGVAVLFAGSLETLRRRRVGGTDSLTAVVLVGALAAGVLLASDVFHSAGSVDALLFGSLLLIDNSDVLLALGALVAVAVAAAVASRAWLATGFDERASRSLGLRSRLPDLLLYGSLALVSVAALAAVGALLTTSLLLVPAATTRLVVRRLPAWQLATMGLTAVEGVAGLWLAVRLDVPPGAAIAVLAGTVFALVAAAGARVAALAAVAVLAGAAFGVSGASGTAEAPSVVATTTVIADWARAVGGDRATVHQLLRPNTDPHEYEPRPSDVERTADAKVVLENGDGLDRWMGDVVRQADGHGTVVDLSRGLPVRLAGESTGAEASAYDPHWWGDPANARQAVLAIRDALSAANPAAAATYRANADAYLRRLDATDRSVAACLDRIPPAQRTLVSDHDAFRYFARRFGIDLVGAVIPSQSTQAQPSAGDLAALVDTIRRTGVRAVFPEQSLPGGLAHQIARATGARADLTLYGDGLGPRSSPGGTYLGILRANADAMADGFSGGAVRCAPEATP